MTTWKHELLRAAEVQTFRLPEGAQVLALQVQDRTPCIWFLVDESREMTYRHFAVYGTGWKLPNDPGSYVGTFQVPEIGRAHV